MWIIIKFFFFQEREIVLPEKIELIRESLQ